MARAKSLTFINSNNTQSRFELSDATVGNPDEFSTSESYAIGDYCIYNNTIYCCIDTVTAGSVFNLNQWKAVTLWSLTNDIEVDMGTISSLPITKGVEGILPNYINKEAILGTPSAQTSDWQVVTAWDSTHNIGTITVSGSISGTTTLKLLMGPIKSVTASAIT